MEIFSKDTKEKILNFLFNLIKTTFESAKNTTNQELLETIILKFIYVYF